jgi:hypothetical protein
MSFDFIKKHIIVEIERMIKYKKDILDKESGFNTFLYFDEPLKSKSISISKMDGFNPYIDTFINIDSQCPSSWYALNGSILLDAYDKIKNNKFYTYKYIDGRGHKIRLKNVNTEKIES